MANSIGKVDEIRAARQDIKSRALELLMKGKVEMSTVDLAEALGVTSMALSWALRGSSSFVITSKVRANRSVVRLVSVHPSLAKA